MVMAVWHLLIVKVFVLCLVIVIRVIVLPPSLPLLIHTKVTTSTPPPPPVTSPPTPTCTNGRVYQTCGTACPLTCENHLSPPLICTLQCVQGCFCPSGLVQNGDSCVTPSDCPSPSPSTCTNGRVFETCGTACPLTCEQPNPRPCTRNCVQGCFCPPGLLQNGETCVNPTDCPGSRELYIHVALKSYT